MRILIVSHEYPPVGGGGANACMYLSREYAKRGHDVDIVTVWYEGTLEKEVLQDSKGTISIYRIKSKRKNKASCSFLEMMDFVAKGLPKASSLVKTQIQSDNQYDMCQVFFGIPSGPIGLYLKKTYKLPYVIRFGGGDIPGFQERFKTVYKVLAPAVKSIWKNADALVANSQGLKDLAEDFCSKYPIEIIYNGVDTEKFYPADGNNLHDQDKVTLLFISRLIERKGLQYVIPKLREIEADSKKKIRLLVVGDGPYRQKLEELAAENNVTRVVEFAGQKDKNELLAYYHKGNVFVFPSMKEGMPNAVLEAMACGLPVVMSPCQGSGELVEGNGIIADADLEHFYKSVSCLVSAPDAETDKMSKASRNRAVELFSWGRVADNYLALFNRIIGK